MDTFVDIVFKSQLLISAAGVIMNLFHLIILLHPRMNISSTNSILIGIATCDLIMLSSIVYDRSSQFFISPIENSCADSEINTFHHEMSQWIGTFWSNILEQTPLWLGVFLALIRLMLMKFPACKDFLSKPAIGYFTVLVTTIITSLMSVYFYFTMKQNELEDSWKNGEICSGTPNESTHTDTQDLERAIHFYVFVSGISQISISLIYPLLTIFLFIEIRKSSSFSTSVLSKKNLLERHRSAKMILVMTVFYVIYSAPTGFFDFIQLFVYVTPFLAILVEYGSVFVSTLFCLNGMSHSVINFFMSSKYRNTLREMLGIKKKVTLIPVSAVSKSS
ncbi:unnamed protein product [Caenorhabditis brenneri]